MDSNYILNITLTMMQGAKTTVLVFFIVIITSIPLGFFVTLLGRSKFRPIGWLVNIYITIMRGTPLILQLFFVYFAMPYIPLIGPYITMERLPAALIAFILNYAAYFAEIFRGGLMAIDKGQNEAAKVLGLNKIQTFIYVIIPQMIRVSLPALSNESITLVKDTSLLNHFSATSSAFFLVSKVEANFKCLIAPPLGQRYPPRVFTTYIFTSFFNLK